MQSKRFRCRTIRELTLAGHHKIMPGSMGWLMQMDMADTVQHSWLKHPVWFQLDDDGALYPAEMDWLEPDVAPPPPGGMRNVTLCMPSFVVDNPDVMNTLMAVVAIMSNDRDSAEAMSVALNALLRRLHQAVTQPNAAKDSQSCDSNSG